jgi:hypothetical protein
MKKVVKLTESDLSRIVKRVINEENKEEDPMKYFENIRGKIQKSILDAVKWYVNPIRIRNHSTYFKQVVDHVWPIIYVSRDENIPSKKDFVKFMKRDYANQILSHHQGLRR